VADESARRIPLGPELDLDEHAVPRHLSQRAAQQHLVVAHAVEVAGVQQGDPGVDGGANGGDALGVVGGSVDSGHPHHPEAHPGDHRAAAAERGRFHLFLTWAFRP
jgi:hypothetical protein